MISDALDAIERHFNDIIGNLIPGAVVLYGFEQIGCGLFFVDLSGEMTAGKALTFGVASFIISHIIGELTYQLKKYRPLKIEKPLSEAGEKSKAQFKKLAQHKFSKTLELDNSAEMPELGDFSDTALRSLAMTMSPKAEILGRRFRFIELFCRGVGTALFILSAALLVSLIPEVETEISVPAPLLTATVSLISSALLFFRSISFDRYADEVPFTCAIGDILQEAEDTPADEITPI